jgi:hypothetical protein
MTVHRRVSEAAEHEAQVSLLGVTAEWVSRTVKSPIADV